MAMKHLPVRVFLFTIFLSTLALAADSGYHVTTTYKLGGDGGWDYLALDGASRHFYISRGTHGKVIDADSGWPLINEPQ
jgi:hypothetical protein